jgi:hypothetical protein
MRVVVVEASGNLLYGIVSGENQVKFLSHTATEVILDDGSKVLRQSHRIFELTPGNQVLINEYKKSIKAASKHLQKAEALISKMQRK